MLENSGRRTGYWTLCCAESAGDAVAEKVFVGESVEGDVGFCGQYGDCFLRVLGRGQRGLEVFWARCCIEF